MSHHLFRLSLPPHDICTRVSELVIGYTMSEYTHTQTPVVHIYIHICELMYALPVAFLHTGLANDVGGVENHIALAITVPCVPPTLLPHMFGAVLFDDCAQAYWRGSLNWRSASVIGFLSLSSLKKGWTAWRRNSAEQEFFTLFSSATSGRQVFFSLGK